MEDPCVYGLNFTFNDVANTSQISPNIGRMIYLSKSIDIDHFYGYYQNLTEYAIKHSNPENVYYLHLPKYDMDRSFPWFNLDLSCALEHSDFRTFLYVLNGWMFWHENRNESLSYTEACNLAKNNTEHGDEIIAFLTQIKELFNGIHPYECENIDDNTMREFVKRELVKHDIDIQTWNEKYIVSKEWVVPGV